MQIYYRAKVYICKSVFSLCFALLYHKVYGMLVNVHHRMISLRVKHVVTHRMVNCINRGNAQRKELEDVLPLQWITPAWESFPVLEVTNNICQNDWMAFAFTGKGGNRKRNIFPVSLACWAHGGTVGISMSHITQGAAKTANWLICQLANNDRRLERGNIIWRLLFNRSLEKSLPGRS